MAGLIEENQVGKREQLADIVSLVDASSTPLTSMIRKGAKLGNTLFEWQVDDYESPSTNSVVDGSDVDTATGAGYTDSDSDSTHDIGEDYTAADLGNKLEDHARKRTRLKNYGHYLRRAFRVSTLSEDVSNVAGVPSEYAKGLAKKTIELKRGMEKTLLGDQNATAQTSSVGYKTRGLGSWTTSGDYADGEGLSVTGDDYYAPNTSAVIAVGGADGTTALTDEDVQGVLEAIFAETGTSNDMDLIGGRALRRAFSGLVASATTLTNYPVAVRTMQQSEDKSFQSTIDVFQGDFGSVRVHADNFADSNTGFLIDSSKLELVYGIMPRTKELTDNGGGKGALIEAFFGLQCLNPKMLGRIKVNQITA